VTLFSDGEITKAESAPCLLLLHAVQLTYIADRQVEHEQLLMLIAFNISKMTVSIVTIRQPT